MRQTRRGFVAGAAALGGSLGASASALGQAAGLPDVPLDREPSLKAIGEKAGIPYGLCEPSSRFPGNRAYMERLAQECSLCVPGNDFNWKNVQPAKEFFRYTQLDQFAGFMRENKLRLVGHTLIWYHSVPEWLRPMEDKADIYAAMERYIGETVRRYRGQVVRWDVINEQIEPKDGLDGGLRKSFYLERLGPEYLKFAFASARQADPKAMLCYNEFGFEHARVADGAKRAALLALLRKMRDDKVEVDCVGFQSHLEGGVPLDLDGLSAFTREVVRLGYKVAITELDVKDTYLPNDIERRDSAVATQVRDYLACVMAETKPLTITSWGYTDDKSWYQYYNWSKRKDGAPLRPLPFDASFGRKSQWQAIAKALRSA